MKFFKLLAVAAAMLCAPGVWAKSGVEQERCQDLAQHLSQPQNYGRVVTINQGHYAQLNMGECATCSAPKRYRGTGGNTRTIRHCRAGGVADFVYTRYNVRAVWPSLYRQVFASTVAGEDIIIKCKYQAEETAVCYAEVK